MTDPQDGVIRRILSYTRRVAVVGLSDEPWRASHGVAAQLAARGYEIIPVNPMIEQALGLPAYPSLADVPGDIDLVDVFRRPEYLPGVAEEAVAIGARGLWLQSGLVSEAARRTAEDAGLDVVQDRCLKIEVAIRAGEMTLPPAA